MMLLCKTARAAVGFRSGAMHSVSNVIDRGLLVKLLRGTNADKTVEYRVAAGYCVGRVEKVGSSGGKTRERGRRATSH